MSSKKSNGNSVKYHATKTIDEHEQLINDLFNRDKYDPSRNERAFDFTSINQYESIYHYRTDNSLKRQNHYSVDSDAKKISGLEKYVYYTIVGIFYLLLVALLPFSLFVCLKKVKVNESLVVYRLGRLKQGAYKPGYCILFPFIDSYKSHSVVPKEFFLPNLQIINQENAIVEISTRIRYNINDVIKMTNSLQDLNLSMKSITRSNLVTILSKQDAKKIEIERQLLAQEVKEAINLTVRKWGIEIIELEITINSVVVDESEDSNQDPALKSLSMVFKSLFNGGSSGSTAESSAKPTTSQESAANPAGFTPNFLSLLQGMTPFVVPPGEATEASGQSADTNMKQVPMADLMSFFMPDMAASAAEGAGVSAANKSSQASGNESEFSPMKLLKLIEPLLTENLVNEIQTVYEFHIRMDSLNTNKVYDQSQVEMFHLDLKSPPKGRIGRGMSLFQRADCIIKMNDQDLVELLTDKLKPFTAYMSGRIEIDGDLQDVFKLKKLIKSVSNITMLKNKNLGV